MRRRGGARGDEPLALLLPLLLWGVAGLARWLAGREPPLSLLTGVWVPDERLLTSEAESPGGRATAKFGVLLAPVPAPLAGRLPPVLEERLRRLALCAAASGLATAGHGARADPRSSVACRSGGRHTGCGCCSCAACWSSAARIVAGRAKPSTHAAQV